MRITLLGTGNAGQVPVYNCPCVACERARHISQYRRGPCSALLEADGVRWLIDAGLTDLTERYPPGSLRGILLTHYHADHAQGLLQLRWGTGLTLAVLGPPDPDGLADLYKHPGILDFSRTLAPFETLNLSADVGTDTDALSIPSTLQATALPLQHSRLTYGYAFQHGRQQIAYLTDTVGVPEASAQWLQGQYPNQTANRNSFGGNVAPDAVAQDGILDLLILDCTHPPADVAPRNHNDLTRALDIVRSLRPRKTVLTHIGHKLDAFLMEHPGSLPDNVVVGRDGDVFELTD